MMDPFYFTFADPDFYEDIGRWRCRPDDPRFRRTRQGAVTTEYRPGWEYTNRGIWTVCSPVGESLVEQGWKLHVAITPETFEQLLRAVADVCYPLSVSFKHLARWEYAWLVNAKYAPRTGSGKGIVLYPDSADLAVKLALSLAEQLRDVQGPRILSDVQIDGTVVHARYGAFVTKYCRDETGKVHFAIAGPDGELVPDRRSVPFTLPEFVTMPDEFTPRPPVQDPEVPVPPYRVEKTLHFSNSGGVYLAKHLESGRDVVLKEARPHAGLDLVGGDAIARAGREVAAMRMFADQPEIPEVYDQFTWQTHVFTAMEYIRGNTLQEWCAANHPHLLRSDPFAPVTREEVDAYRDRVESILDRLDALVRVIWDRGYVVGDLHPANVMVTPELDIKLLDLEACLPHDADRPFPGVPGFIDFRRRGQDSDAFGLAMLRISCYLPLTQLIRMDAGKLGELLATARSWFKLPAAWADSICAVVGTPPSAAVTGSGATANTVPDTGGPGDFPSWSAQIVAGFDATMTEDRPDRLLPCDTTGYVLPPVSLATGAAGPLWALLSTTGIEAADQSGRIADWIVVNGRASTKRPECGLYDSALGAGYVLQRAGYPEHAKWLVALALGKDRTRCDLSIFSGQAGIFLATSALSHGPDALVPTSLVAEVGEDLARGAAALLARLQAGDAAASVKYGLMHGLAGTALATHRYGRLAGDDAAVDCARGLLEHELAAYTRCKDGSLQFNEADRRTLAYLEEGSCGAALALAELSTHQSWAAAGYPLVDLIRALGPEVMFQSGLFRGRAGFLAGVAQLAKDGHEAAAPLVDRHLGYLYLHELRPRPGELHFPGTGNYKISCDLRTGSAGVLTAVAFATGQRTDWLPGVF